MYIVKRLIMFAVITTIVFSMGSYFQCSILIRQPSRNLSLDELQNDTTYWNEMDDKLLKDKLIELSAQSAEYHMYVENEFDCNDMSLDLWNMLYKEEIISIIVIGDLDKEKESFIYCNHSWIVVINNPPGSSDITLYAIEPTNDKIYVYGPPRNSQYFEGFFYALPSALRADLGERW